jgi:hypothetical protein
MSRQERGTDAAPPQLEPARDLGCEAALLVPGRVGGHVRGLCVHEPPIAGDRRRRVTPRPGPPLHGPGALARARGLPRGTDSSTRDLCLKASPPRHGSGPDDPLRIGHRVGRLDDPRRRHVGDLLERPVRHQIRQQRPRREHAPGTRMPAPRLDPSPLRRLLHQTLDRGRHDRPCPVSPKQDTPRRPRTAPNVSAPPPAPGADAPRAPR